jgi:exodeoxyribonuclease V alpha subunit
MLAGFARQRILCAVHRGPSGVERFNQHAAELLTEAGLINPPDSGPYRKQPIILTRNDHQLRVYNGDTGMLAEGDEAGRLDACFLDLQSGLRRLPALRLPPYAPAFAITIHRSQGSEFDNVLIVLPSFPNRALTRELLYTAVSRAREGIVIWGSQEAVQACFRNGVARASGLVERLTGASDSAMR